VPKAHLTDITVRSLKPPPPGRNITYFDDQTPGFGIRISYSGRKTWIVMRGKERGRTRLGYYPDLSLAAARNRAKALLLEQRPPPTLNFEDALNLFLSVHCAQKNKPRTAAETERLLRRHFMALKARQLSDISHHHIMTVLDGLLGTPSEANHAFTAIRTFFRFAVRRRLTAHSPVDGLQLPSRVVARERVLTDDELVRVWNAAAQIGYPFGRIVQLLILTGQRRGEIASLRWEWIDGVTITLPKEVVKNNRTHTFPVGTLASQIIQNIPRLADLLFPARGNDSVPFGGWSKAKPRLDNLSGVAGYTLHDCRRTFAVGLQRCGVRVDVIETILNHRSGVFRGIVGVYQRHDFMDEMRAAIALWEERLASLLAQHAPANLPPE
jgi:integrase